MQNRNIIISGFDVKRMSLSSKPLESKPIIINEKPIIFGSYFTSLTSITNTPDSYDLLKLKIKPIYQDDNKDFKYRWIRLSGFELPKNLRKVLANGFNGWSFSPLLDKDEILFEETNILQRPFGDYNYYQYSEKPGIFHSWSFSYGDCGNDGNIFFGSTDERNFYTLFEFDLKKHTFSIIIDTDGFIFNTESNNFLSDNDDYFPLGEWLIYNGGHSKSSLSSISNTWIERICKVDRRRLPNLAHKDVINLLGTEKPIRGYTSWYYRYNNIDPDWLSKNLAAIPHNSNWKIFQIDDGYQNAIGDWLLPNKKFTDGISQILTSISERGLYPGLWCAPFIGIHSSEIFKNHSEWFQRSKEDDLNLCGDFEHWGGKFYGLDFENKDVQNYLEKVLTTMCKTWGARFIKMDFLYATSMVPGGGLTRAARASRSHSWLFNLCRELGVLFLSCGANVSSSLGLCHFSRIGADIGLNWGAANPRHKSREQVHTKASMTNTITRSFLNGITFANDPDVYILRNTGVPMTVNQKKSLVDLNHILGNLVFTSDFLQEYTESQLLQKTKAEMLRSELRLKEINLITSPEPDRYILKYTNEEIHVSLEDENPFVKVIK